MHAICNRRPGLNVRLLMLAFVWLAPGLAWSRPEPVTAAPQPTANAPFLRATPNPIVSPNGKGSTTIDWKCDSPEARVYLSVDGGAEQIFSSGMVGHQEVPWISAGPVYEFRLYEGAERTRRLASVTVTCSRTPSPVAPAGSTLPPTAADRGAQPAPEGSFSVTTGIVLAALGIASVVVPFFVMRLFMISGRRGSVARGEKPSAAA